ncbi:hypothetical protein SAMN05518861_11662 [Mesorhizobium sp. YR577]|nr:hypothetical protein SAMN05518861_11662 [Mesorhizobium sp. YR577]
MDWRSTRLRQFGHHTVDKYLVAVGFEEHQDAAIGSYPSDALSAALFVSRRALPLGRRPLTRLYRLISDSITLDVHATTFSKQSAESTLTAER